MNRDEALLTIAAEVVNCTACELHSSRKCPVPGEGPSNAEIMFIGEGPGFHENEQGRPFVGASGKFLTAMLAGCNMRREQVFIANVVKCRPPGNRDPQPDEIAACGKYLDRQIEVIDPRIIVTLGRFSMARYFPKARISAIHGQAKMMNGRLIVPFYHPAAALHQPALRKVVQADFQLLPGYLIKLKTADAEPAADTQVDDPQQLSFF